MVNKYSITGMTCGSCVSKVQKALIDSEYVQNSVVQLEYPQAVITSQNSLDLIEINKALSVIGNYKISKEVVKTIITPLPEIGEIKQLSEKSINTYKPLILIVAFIMGVSLLTQFPFDTFSYMLWMRNFMAGFFIVFAFFKLLNLKGFADTYSMYDVIATTWKPWGYIYPFVELLLGISYITNIYSFETNLVTAVILGVSSIGVILSNLNNKKIKCACLGDVFNLPMSTVTIVEDLTMMVMAIIMLSIS